MNIMETSTVNLPEGVVENNVGRAVLQTLAGYGIDTIFGIPGTHNLEFYRHMQRLGLHAVTARHEQGAGYGADGWSQQTGLPGVVITTSGPGLLNALSAAGTAYCESRPFILLSPGVPQGEEFADIGALHETKDATGAAGAIVEWSRRAANGTEAVQAIHDAFELFRTGRPRPVHIEVPLNVLEGPSDVDEALLLPVRAPALAQASEEMLDAAASALAGASRPVILAGGGSLAAGDGVRQLAERLGAPVITTLNGKAAVSEDHPLSVGSELRLQACREEADAADVLLIVGSKVGDSELWFERLAPRGTVIRVDRLSSQMNKNVAGDVHLVGDSASVIPALIDRLGSAVAVDRAEEIAAVRQALEEEARSFAPDLAALAEDLAAVLPADTILAGDSSQVTYLGTASFVKQTRPHSFLYTPAYATLGYGLPAAIGAKIASPERPVVCVLGDGALMFAVQEFATALEQNLDLVVVCVDNGGYGEIQSNEADRGIAPIGVQLHQPDWAALVTAFGGVGESVQSREELAPAVASAIEAGGVRLVHVKTSAYQG